MRKILFGLFLIFCNATLFAQQKKWYDDYWVSANVNLLFSQNNNTGGGMDFGKTIKNNYVIGMGFDVQQFNEIAKATTLHLYAEKFIKGKKRELYFFGTPGVAFSNNTEQHLQQISRFEYKKSIPGFHLHFGSGIRWMVKRHAFFINAGYGISNYKILANNYPIPIDPYNPFYEDVVVYQYKLQYQRVVISLGVRL